ncbi:unnamed protein product [Fraxinus pennsylvanica]|uniref:CRAL-TRIO domain-containing protein n=1 Tax=Fraxinus pennsylvanica TaxID=56036 RepID=A0AAD2DZB7_9LAMI|nr:unnamed protein product [Fraxinus pennsylvanica]
MLTHKWYPCRTKVVDPELDRDGSQGKDKRGFTILRIIGKNFLARVLNVDALKKYLEGEIFPSLGENPFSVVYVNTGGSRSDNFPGISALRSIYEAIPVKISENLDSIYFLHSVFQSRLFLVTFGHLIFPELEGGIGR